MYGVVIVKMCGTCLVCSSSVPVGDCIGYEFT